MKKTRVYFDAGRSLWRLFTYTINAFWLWGIWRLFGGMVSSFLNIMLSKTMGEILDIAILNDYTKAASFVITVSVLMAARCLTTCTNTITSARYQISSSCALRELASRKINRLPIHYFENQNSINVFSRSLSCINKISEFLPNFMAGPLSHTPVNIIFGLFILFGISWKLTLITLFVVSITLFVIKRASSSSHRKTEAERNSYIKANTIFHDFLKNIEVYKVFKMQGTHGKKYEEALYENQKDKNSAQKTRVIAGGISSLNQLLPWVLSYVFGSYFAIKGEITVGELYAFSAVLPNITLAAQQIGGALISMLEHGALTKQFFEIIDEEEERRDGETFATDGNVAVGFNNVSFSYTNHHQILNGCSFEIPDGATVGIVGKSGCGKTTILKLILGYYQEYTGSISVYNHPIEQWSLSDLRKKFSYVGQNCHLFNGSIMENIRYGNLTSSDQQVIEAAKMAGAHSFITQMKDGYFTDVGEGGKKLSGGQKQLINLARAILHDGKVFVLDEPTSALDAYCESCIRDAIERMAGMKTIIIVTHKISTIKNLDLILVVDNGKISESGTHQQLVSSGGRYSELYFSQNEKD